MAEEVRLKAGTEDAAAKLAERIEKGAALVARVASVQSEEDLGSCQEEYSAWSTYNRTLLLTLFSGPITSEYDSIAGAWAVWGTRSLRDQIDELANDVRSKLQRLRSIHERLPLWSVSADSKASAPNGSVSDPLDSVLALCEAFPRVARQIQNRHAGRGTLKITDEYDVQDLLHALLRISFEDVRPEEVSPSYAGQSGRMDFLLKRERLVVEVKMTRDGLGAKDVANQLIEDIARYAQHGDCKMLV